MAAGLIPAPGTRLGPCKGECEHRDCAANRKQAESACALCTNPIGYDTRFYARENGVLLHVSCFVELLIGTEDAGK